MLNLQTISIAATGTLLLALYTMPVTAESRGFSAARQPSKSAPATRANPSRDDLYLVRDHRKKHHKRHKRHRHHRHNRHNRHRSRLFLFHSPYDPFYAPPWGYAPDYYYYEGRPRSGITFYFSN
jgi:hypothetical protein